jgi:hypothetical protein
MYFIREKGFSEKYTWEEIEELGKSIEVNALKDEEKIVD